MVKRKGTNREQIKCGLIGESISEREETIDGY